MERHIFSTALCDVCQSTEKMRSHRTLTQYSHNINYSCHSTAHTAMYNGSLTTVSKTVRTCAYKACVFRIKVHIPMH